MCLPPRGTADTAPRRRWFSKPQVESEAGMARRFHGHHHPAAPPRATRPRRAVALAAFLTALPAPVLAQGLPDYDFQWAVIGDPGNPGADLGNGRGYDGRGSVDYVYRMAVTELTIAHYLEFIEAYLPYYDGDPTSMNYT